MWKKFYLLMFKYIDEKKKLLTIKQQEHAACVTVFFCQGIHSCDGVCDGITEEVSWGDAAAS